LPEVFFPTKYLIFSGGHTPQLLQQGAVFLSLKLVA
jgi:hypothetical protein